MVIRKNQIAWKMSRVILLITILSMCLAAVLGSVLFLNRTKSNALNDKENLMEEIMNQLDYHVDTIYRESVRITQDGELLNLIGQYYNGEVRASRVNLKLNQLMNPVSEYIDSIIIKTSDGIQFDSIVGLQQEHFVISDELLDNREYYFSKPQYYTDSYGNAQGKVEFMTRMEIQGKADAIVVLSLDMNVFNEIFQAFEMEADHLVWLGYDNEALNSTTYTSEELDVIRAECENKYLNYSTRIKHKGDYTLIRFSEKCNWKMVAEMSQQTLLKNYYWIYVFYLTVVLFMGIVIIACVLPLLRYLLKPLNVLSQHMKRLTGTPWEDVGAFNCENASEEIVEIGESFNYMVGELEANKEKMLRDEQEKAHMRYSLLISQIKPHFIYNTLNIITYLVRSNRHNEIIRVNQALIRILKDTLRVDNIQIYDSVAHEMSIVEQYILIEKYRYGDFHFEVNITPDARKMNIPKNIIQPLVENALFHGLVPVMGDNFVGRIIVDVSLEGGHIIIKVKDNGAGMSDERLVQVLEGYQDRFMERGHHIGLKNVRERMKHIYKDMDCMERVKIHSKQGSGTEVTVILDEDIG